MDHAESFAPQFHPAGATKPTNARAGRGREIPTTDATTIRFAIMPLLTRFYTTVLPVPRTRESQTVAQTVCGAGTAHAAQYRAMPSPLAAPAGLPSHAGRKCTLAPSRPPYTDLRCVAAAERPRAVAPAHGRAPRGSAAGARLVGRVQALGRERCGAPERLRRPRGGGTGGVPAS